MIQDISYARSDKSRIFDFCLYHVERESTRIRWSEIFAESQRSMCLRERRKTQMKLDAVRRIKRQWDYHGIG